MMRRDFAVVALGMLTAGLAGAGRATAQTVIYDNTVNPSGGLSFTGLEIGDEVLPATDERAVTQLLVGVSQQGFAGTADLQARLYANDGSGGAPGTLLWESILFDDVELSGEVELIAFDVPDVEVPDIFTWTIQISDTDPVAVGVPHFHPPEVGASPDHAWFGGPGSWTKLEDIDGRPVNLMCRVVSGGTGGGLMLDVSGDCPGTVRAQWIGATPNVTLALLISPDTGSFVIPPGNPCAGTQLGLAGNGLDVVSTFGSGADGSGSRQGQAGIGACGRFLQLLELGSCATSNVDQIP